VKPSNTTKPTGPGRSIRTFLKSRQARRRPVGPASDGASPGAGDAITDPRVVLPRQGGGHPGPYVSERIRNWWKKQMFPPTLEISTTGEPGTFKRIDHFVPDPSLVFLYNPILFTFEITCPLGRSAMTKHLKFSWDKHFVNTSTNSAVNGGFAFLRKCIKNALREFS
jgi:hypothetical protein